MQFHALSWLSHGRPVNIIGLKGELPAAALGPHLTEIVDVKVPGPWILSAPLRAVLNAWHLLTCLALKRTNVILVQNPPSIPTLIVVLLASSVNGAAVVIDWHNLGFKMLEHGKRAPKFLVFGAKAYEKFCSSMADGHLCVTRALSEWLENEFRIHSTVLYDCPHSEFKRLDAADKLQTRCRLPLNAPWLQDEATALLVSATSWTADEDFEMLLQGLVLYAEAGRGPRLVTIITGKGPLKAHYETRVRQLEPEFANRVCVQTAWLSNDDYPRLLGSANLGISMHTSTSGLDLPMKIVDYFGAGLPVLAADFACISELVKKSNGRVFSSSTEFARELESLLSNFPYSNLLPELGKDDMLRWEPNWDAVALPVLMSAASSPVQLRKRILLAFSLIVPLVGVLIRVVLYVLAVIIGY